MFLLLSFLAAAPPADHRSADLVAIMQVTLREEMMDHVTLTSVRRERRGSCVREWKTFTYLKSVVSLDFLMSNIMAVICEL